MADPITDIESLKHYIGQLCYSRLGSDDKATTEIVIAVNRDTFMNAQELDKLLEDAIKIGFDADETEVEDEVRAEKLKAIDERIATVVSRVVSGIEQQRAIPKDKRSTAERLVNDYFFPALYKERTAAAVLHDSILGKLEDDPKNAELAGYQSLLDDHISYLDAVAHLPFAAEKLVGALQQNSGRNYTPRQNAQVISALLDTVQKSQEGSWTAEKLVQTVKIIAKMTIPDLPVDSVTLESIQDLLPVVNGILDQGKKLEKQKTEFFLEKAEEAAKDETPEQTMAREAREKARIEQSSARKALFSAMGIEFPSLTTLCVNSLYKPMQELTQAAGNAGAALGQFSTWDGNDWVQFLNGVEEAGVAIGTIPKEIRDRLPGFVDYVKYAGDAVAVGSAIVSVTGEVVGGLTTGLGSFIKNNSSESVRNTADAMLDATASLYRAVGPTAGKVASWALYLLPSHYTPYVAKQTHTSMVSRLWGGLTSLVSAPVKEKFSDEGEFWARIQPSTSPGVAEDFFNIHALVKASGCPALEKEFFDAYMARPEVQVKSSYESYVAFKDEINPETLNTRLDTQLKSFAGAKDSEKGDKANYMIQRVKKLETEIKRSEKSMANFNELAAAMAVKSDDPKVQAFQKFYVRPALDRAALHNQQKQLMPKLEKELDKLYDQSKGLDEQAKKAFYEIPSHVKLRDIYSKLKGGQLLNSADVVELEKYRDENDRSLNLLWIAELADSFPPPEAPKPPKAFTPKEEARQSYQATLESVHPIFGNISQSLEKQLAACRGLRDLSPNDPLKSLCDAKINYLEALNKAVTKLMTDIKKDDDLAEEIRKLAGGEIDMSDVLSAQALSKQLISLAWETVLPKSGMLSASMPEKILAYAMSKNEHLDGIVQAKVKYEKTFKDTPPPPELMTQLSNPLTSNQLANEETVKRGIGGALNTVTGFIPGMAQYYALSMPLAYVMPQALIADVAIGVLARPEVQEKLFPKALQSVFSTVGGVVDSAKNYLTGVAAEKLKNVLCPYLNIEVQKILEQKAFDYISKDPSKRSTLKANEREAFSGFYLQYRAIKKNNPALDRTQCAKYLFSESLKGKPESEHEDFLKKISDEFKRVDDTLKAQMPPTSQEAELERELEFLMQNVDFNSPDETALVGMCVYNRLMMMQMNASKEVTEEQARQLQQKAMSTLGSVLEKLEEADAINPSTPEQPRTKARAAELQDATKVLAKAKFEELSKELTATSQLIELNIKDRKERLIPESRENEPKLAGRTAIAAELDKSVKVGPSMRILKTIGNLATPIIFWAFVGVAITAGGVGLGALTAVGLGSPIGAAILGAIVVAKVAFNTVREVRARDNEFEAIKARTDISPFQKTLLTGLNYLKCFGIGLVKAVVTDTIYNKVSGIFTSGVKPIVDTVAEARDLVRKHPKVETVVDEMELLSTLKTDLDTFHQLVKDQIAAKEKVGFSATKPNPKDYTRQSSYDADVKAYEEMQARANKIKEMGEQIKAQLETAQQALATSSDGDVRWKGTVNPVNEELESYKAAFGKINKAMDDVELIHKAEVRMQPEKSEHEVKAKNHAKEANRQLEVVKQVATGIQVEREKFSTDDLLKNNKKELKEMAVRVRQTIRELTAGAEAVEEQYRSSYEEAGKAGEVGHLSTLTAITGPTLTASNQAKKAWESAKEVVTESQQFLKTIETELARITHETVVGHTAKVHEHLEQVAQASKEALGERGTWGEQRLLAEILEDLEESDDREEFINGLDYEDIQDSADSLREVLAVMENATRLAAQAYQEAFQAIKKEESGVQPQKATEAALAKAEEALKKAQKVEKTARDVLKGIDEVLAEIGYVQKAETQLEKANSSVERIGREQKKFDAMRKIDYEALDLMIEEVGDEVENYLGAATRKLVALDQTVSELAKTNPEMQEESEAVKEALQEAQALESDAREFLATLQTVRAQKDIEAISVHTAKMQEHLEKVSGAVKYVESLRERFTGFMNGLKTGEYKDDEIDFALEDIAETLTKKIRGMEEATRAAAEHYEQVSQAVKAVEQSGVEIGELTLLAYDKAKAALENAQKEDIRARALLTTVEQEITRIKETPTVAVVEEFDEEDQDEFFSFEDDEDEEFVDAVETHDLVGSKKVVGAEENSTNVEAQKLTTLKDTQSILKEHLREHRKQEDEEQNTPASPAA
ncbi:Uncharacterised protein [Legionella donaldsonii]|uniref:Uncharacterized protein n=1 Tax=Legionella donaldsonii TaxID=45060 RepID=A0A378J4Q6_9GAMM|nr:hypothetical protein [Legionella donaldsonii]STX42733.1 Uncharacterised protein [Legionella donaldsonii]